MIDAAPSCDFCRGGAHDLCIRGLRTTRGILRCGCAKCNEVPA